jgi:hypothetical protein
MKEGLQTFARNNGIELYEHKEQIVAGWEGQSKGLLQVLCERGLTKTKMLDKYTLNGQKDTITGKVDLLFLLCHLLAECTDFKNEEMALQYLGTQLGVTVQLMPNSILNWRERALNAAGLMQRPSFDKYQ